MNGSQRKEIPENLSVSVDQTRSLSLRLFISITPDTVESLGESLNATNLLEYPSQHTIIRLRTVKLSYSVRGKLGSVKSPVTQGVTGAVRL